MDFTFRYLRDEDIDADLDLQLRSLLRECFPHEARHLETKRYFHECPQNRWLAFAPNGALAAHVAAHEKVIGAETEDLKIIGVAEVSVAPQFRGKKLVKSLLRQAQDWGKGHGFSFAVLFGDQRIYSSSGYTNVLNPINTIDVETGKNLLEVRRFLMVRPLDDSVWPEGEIDLRGPTF
jgi:predicted N-acetyltransferase YhbS